MNQWIGIGDIHNDVSKINYIPEIKEVDGIIIHGDITFMGDRKQAASMISQIEQKNSTIYAQAGNMDGTDVQADLSKTTTSIHCKGFELSPGIGIMGVGMSTPTPFQTPGEFSDDQMEKWLEETWKHIQHMDHIVLVTHDPPYGTNLDITSDGVHVGSRAVLNFIEKHQPDILLCGHIHESRNEDNIGRTKAVNPGMLADGGYALIQYDNNILDIMLKII
ncbi:serine/threonine protein phosphatase [Candidatus Magnetomorum sp. HK-1]|nr:serine/threonine protein phosphatase [Candidatus Magnetomorum sp. HK-1]